jgi:hypothetical protein
VTIAWVFFGVALTALILQSISLARLLSPSALLPAKGLRRTAVCRVATASVYVGLAIFSLYESAPLTLADVTLGVFTAVQLVWISNGLLDVRLRRKLEPRLPRHRRIPSVTITIRIGHPELEKPTPTDL